MNVAMRVRRSRPRGVRAGDGGELGPALYNHLQVQTGIHSRSSCEEEERVMVWIDMIYFVEVVVVLGQICFGVEELEPEPEPPEVRGRWRTARRMERMR